MVIIINNKIIDNDLIIIITFYKCVKKLTLRNLELIIENS